MNLDDKSAILALDPKDMNASLINFPNQCKQGWEEAQKIDFPEEYKNANAIVNLAMGGSILGAIVAKKIFHSELNIPFEHFSGYDIPSYTNNKTLAIVSSTSGNTEETLSMYNQAKEKTNMVFCMTTGGKLGELAKKDNFPLYLIDDSEFNPSSVPRVSVGFQLGAYFGMLSKLGYININSDEFSKMVDDLKQEVEKISVNSNKSENEAKQIAEKLKGKIAVVIASEHLFGASKVINNQINESGKSFSCNFELPDVNHHQLEGMQFPSSNPENLIYFLIESGLYNDRNSKRFDILKKLLDDLGIDYVKYTPNLNNKTSQAFETVQFGGYMTYYLGLLNEVDPAPNPFVDKFKNLLGQPL